MSKWSDAINVEEYIGDEGVWSRVDWLGLVEANVKGLVALVGGLIVTAVGVIPRTAVQSLEALGSFGEDVVETTVAVPTQIIEGSFDAAIAEITTHGAAGAVSVIALLALAFAAYNLGVRFLAS